MTTTKTETVMRSSRSKNERPLARGRLRSVPRYRRKPARVIPGLSATGPPHAQSPASEHIIGLFAAKDLGELIDAAFRVLHVTVACDFVSALYRGDSDGMTKERDSLGHAYGPAFMRRYAELTPAIPLVRANPGIKFLKTRDAITGSETALRRTPFFREVMRPQGWRHGVALCFWNSPPAEMPLLVVSVYRRDGRSDFSRREVASLAAMHPFIECAVRCIYERETSAMLLHGVALTPPSVMSGFAILDRNLVLVEANAAARELCDVWLSNSSGTQPRGDSGGWQLPSDLAAECLSLDHAWRSHLRVDPEAVGGTPRSHLVAHTQVIGLTASVTMLCPSVSGLADPIFALEFDRRVQGAALDTVRRDEAVLEKLTKAERAIATVLADGLSNQEIADTLGKTVHAVKFLLHRIYQKTGIPNRAALVAVMRSRGARSARQSGQR